MILGEPQPGALLMDTSLHDILASYNDRNPLEQAYTIPASWYVDGRVAELERQNVFGRTWQVVARVDQLQQPPKPSFWTQFHRVQNLCIFFIWAFSPRPAKTPVFCL